MIKFGSWISPEASSLIPPPMRSYYRVPYPRAEFNSRPFNLEPKRSVKINDLWVIVY